MSDESARAVGDLAYIYGYFRVISPSLLRLALLAKGIDTGADRPARYLELGFGQGLSLGIHAAACPGEFWGNDINLEHVSHARGLADASGAATRIAADSFADLLARDDLPEFDAIVLHGIWTWVSEENAAEIVELARRKLAPGGLLYVSYNCNAGWGAASFLRDLLRLHAEHEASNDQALTSRVEGAIGFARLLAQSGANYFRYNPTAAMQLSALTQQDSTYISHELFGENWRLTSFGEIAAQLSNADLTFGASAVLIGHIDRYSLPPAGHEILKLVTSPIVKEAVKDSFGSPQFRQDIFVRGPVREFSPQERLERLRQMRFVLAIARADVSLNISGPLGDLRLPPESYGPLLDFLATQNYAPKSFAAFEQILPGRSPEQIIEELLVLIGASYVWPVQDDASTAAAQERCNALNAFICKRARSSSAIGFLASPVVGGGIAAHRVWQLFLLAIAEGATSAEEWADFAKLHLESTGEQMFNQGKPIEGAVERAAFLVAVARAFEVRHLPVLRAIGVSAG